MTYSIEPYPVHSDPQHAPNTTNMYTHTYVRTLPSSRVGNQTIDRLAIPEQRVTHKAIRRLNIQQGERYANIRTRTPLHRRYLSIKDTYLSIGKAAECEHMYIQIYTYIRTCTDIPLNWGHFSEISDTCIETASLLLRGFSGLHYNLEIGMVHFSSYKKPLQKSQLLCLLFDSNKKTPTLNHNIIRTYMV